jgi:cytochrome c peroxidase
MHDGRFKKIKDVINHYDNSKNFRTNLDPSLHVIGSLTATKKNLQLFLPTLADKALLYDRRFYNLNIQC